MAVKVLGPLDTGSSVPLSPRERAVLSALIVRAPAPMSGAELADAHWGDRLPKTWTQQVKTSINRIRSRIGATAIQTTATGYRFALEPESVDAVLFEQLVAAARAQAVRGELPRGIDTYRRALALWRGSPYPDLGDWEPGRAEAARLSGIRASAQEELLDARRELWVVSADGSQPRQVTRLPHGWAASSPTFAPDGTRVAVSIDGGGWSAIAVAELAGGGAPKPVLPLRNQVPQDLDWGPVVRPS